MANIDPNLASSLDNNVDGDAVIKVVAVLNENITTEEHIKDIITTIEQSTNTQPINFQYMPFLNVLTINANKKFIKKLVENTNVSSATIVQ